jgi:hypothetical protein
MSTLGANYSVSVEIGMFMNWFDWWLIDFVVDGM